MGYKRTKNPADTEGNVNYDEYVGNERHFCLPAEMEIGKENKPKLSMVRMNMAGAAVSVSFVVDSKL